MATCVGRPTRATEGYRMKLNSSKEPGQGDDEEKEETYFVGQGLQARRGILSIDHPMQHGIVTGTKDRELVTKIWDAMLEEQLTMNPDVDMGEVAGIFVCENAMTSASQRT